MGVGATRTRTQASAGTRTRTRNGLNGFDKLMKSTEDESSTSTAKLSTSTKNAGTVKPDEFSPAELVVYAIKLKT